jgi:hypothetical protein
LVPAAAYVLALISSDLVFLGTCPSYCQIIQVTIVVLVVMAGGLAALRRGGNERVIGRPGDLARTATLVAPNGGRGTEQTLDGILILVVTAAYARVVNEQS